MTGRLENVEERRFMKSKCRVNLVLLDPLCEVLKPLRGKWGVSENKCWSLVESAGHGTWEHGMASSLNRLSDARFSHLRHRVKGAHTENL